MRATDADSSEFQRIFGDVMDQLGVLAQNEYMRWRELMWMLISWVIRRRPLPERQPLVDIAYKHQTETKLQEEIQTMSSIWGQTLEEWAEERGIEKGSLETCREMLCEMLEQRFGILPDEVRVRIQQTSEFEKLRAAHRRVLKLDSLDQLEI